MPVTYRTPGLVLTEHELEVPLDHADPGGERITVFAREVADPDGLDRPFLLYLQGGPGFEAPRPTRHPSGPGWLDRALQDFRVVMLDQRGTGRSTPVGIPPGATAAEQASYLTHFRADSIVRDAELVRAALGADRWTVLGQSYGGMCTVTYLSIAPEGMKEALITGGVPPIDRTHVDDVYSATYARQLERNRRYLARYPEDAQRIAGLADRLEREDVRLPNGDRLSGRLFRTIGRALGMSEGADRLHYLLELPADSLAFRHDVVGMIEFPRNPIYAILHEASWADGFATNWSAARVMPPEYDERPELLTGEHIYPWMFEDIGALGELREPAEILAAHDWPRLYDEEALRANEIPVACAIYAEDPYVERRFSEASAAAIRGMRPWLTNEYDHNGLRADGARILGRLLDLVRGRA